MSIVTIKQLLETGVHFGHCTSNWNPKMDSYIFTSRNKVHIIDLEKTVEKIKEAYNFVRDKVADGGVILFVCTKKQANDFVAEEAKRCGMYYVNYRWWGGQLTNFETISKSIARLEELQTLKEDGFFETLSKKELSRVTKEMARLVRGLSGIKDMRAIPDILFVIDIDLEELAIKEARKLNIPIVALVDTNCNPDGIDFVIPGNDDAVRAIKLVTTIIADAVTEGLQMRVEDKESKESEEEQINTSEESGSIKQKTHIDTNKTKEKEIIDESDKSDTKIEGIDGSGADGLQESVVEK